MALAVESLSLGYQEELIIENINVTIEKGKITTIIGPNGSGKSTLLRALCRILEPRAGLMLLDGTDILRKKGKDIAKQLSFLPQIQQAPDGLTVEELVSYGRAPYQKGFGVLRKKDNEIIDWAISVTSLDTFRERTLNSLSGGQRQRAWIAMSLAQDTSYLLLDEPTTYLDLAHQLEVLKLLKELNKTENKTILMVLHDLNDAAKYSDRLIAIKDGKVAKEGAPIDVLTPEMLENVFGIRAKVFIDENCPYCIPQDLI